MEALQNLLNNFMYSAKKGELSSKAALPSSCSLEIAQEGTIRVDQASINKQNKSYKGFSMPNIKENVLQSLIM